jgi:hypothetical protein
MVVVKMSEEKRTCKTCNQFGEHVNYCHLHDSSHAEWDTCPDHETYEEFEARAKKEHGLKKNYNLHLETFAVKFNRTMEEYAIAGSISAEDALDSLWASWEENILPLLPIQDSGEKT